MTVRYFTLEEANAALPRLRALIEEIWQAREVILAARPELEPVVRQLGNNGGSRKAGEMVAEFDRIQRAVREIQDIGCLLRDLDRGLVDFLSHRAGREVYLCWQYGEPQVLFWHDLETGFAGRQPL
ncbi:MAG: hypothetical protein Kow0047_18020 [Anaerolineae bacterium]